MWRIAVGEAALRCAVESSRFQRLQALEASSQIPGLHYDKSQRDARRVRRGLIGSGREDLRRALGSEAADRWIAELERRLRGPTERIVGVGEGL